MSAAAVTALDFHTGVADAPGYCCRLLRKAWRAGRLVAVTGDTAALSRLDVLLWTFDVGEFIPHGRLRGGELVEAHLRRTPIWLVDRAADAPSRDVLINLGPDPVADVAAFARLIEVVGHSDDAARLGRQRWRHYLSQGFAPRNHPQAPTGG